MRFRLAIALSLTLVATPAAAETLGMWTYTPPNDFTLQKGPSQHAYTRITGRTFCVIGVYLPRPEGADLATDLAQEWSSLVTAKFTASDVKAYPAKTIKGLTHHVTGATIADAKGTYYTEVSVIREHGGVGSVMLMSNSAKTITSCHPTVTALTGSITIGTTATTATTVAPVEKAAAGSVVGVWGVELTLRDQRSGWSSGYTMYQYDLRSDGTYVFTQEQKRPTQFTTYFNSEELGAYKVDGSKLTITPTSAKGTVRDDKGNVIETSKPALEKTTYTFSITPAEGSQEAKLYWTPSTVAKRDSTPNGGSSLPGGYILLNPKKLHWKY